MKKRILTMLLVLVLVAALLPNAAFAASSFESKYLPNGKVSTPRAAYLLYEKSDSYGDSITMWYNPSQELRTLNEAYERYRESGKEFEDYFGVYDYEVSMQIDMKIDNGAWQYTSDWDDPNWSGLDTPHYLAFCSKVSPNTDAGYEELTLSDLYHLGDGSDSAFLAPAIYTATNEYGDTRCHYDLSGHTVSVRYRFAVNVSPEYGVYSMVFSDWSPVTSIGKNGTQKTHTAPTSLAAPVLSDFSIVKYEDGGTAGNYFIDFPDSVYDAVLYCEADQDVFQPMYLQAQMRVNGGEWADVYTANPCYITEGYRAAAPDGAKLKENDAVEVRVQIRSDFLGMISPWSNTVGTKTTYQASDWAQDWIAQADELGLIPTCLVGQDLTRPITRQEFAAVAVKIYEALTGTASAPVAKNPFTDCSDPEVLKAYNIGITNGTATDKFSPNATLNREQLATMLTRTYKKVAISGWTLETDGSFDAQFKAMFTMPAAFADDAEISAWAKDSVYFMKAQGIIDGIGNNLFAPSHGMTANEAAGYGLATCEQALKIAVGMVTGLK